MKDKHIYFFGINISFEIEQTRVSTYQSNTPCIIVYELFNKNGFQINICLHSVKLTGLSARSSSIASLEYISMRNAHFTYCKCFTLNNRALNEK